MREEDEPPKQIYGSKKEAFDALNESRLKVKKYLDSTQAKYKAMVETTIISQLDRQRKIAMMPAIRVSNTSAETKFIRSLFDNKIDR